MQSHGSKWSVPSKSDIRELLADVYLPHSGVSLSHSGSKDIQEEESESEYGTYGGHYEEITEEHFKQIALELGHIKLYWPQQLIPDVDQYVCNYIL
jgi:hypothetical protein